MASQEGMYTTGSLRAMRVAVPQAGIEYRLDMLRLCAVQAGARFTQQAHELVILVHERVQAFFGDLNVESLVLVPFGRRRAAELWTCVVESLCHA
jgi:hypothetical protein